MKFAQLTTKYWEPFGPERPGWLNLGYHLPPGCSISNDTQLCPSGSLDAAMNVTVCQLCPGNGSDPWTYYEWILTGKPHVFGLMPGWANPTGVALISVLTLMVICSLPFVRRGGYFEVIINARENQFC